MKKEKKKTSSYTRRIFFKDAHDVEYRCCCPRDSSILMADDSCWSCEYNMRKKYDVLLPPFTIECSYPY